jgi:hypothetical protein
MYSGFDMLAGKVVAIFLPLDISIATKFVLRIAGWSRLRVAGGAFSSLAMQSSAAHLRLKARRFRPTALAKRFAPRPPTSRRASAL